MRCLRNALLTLILVCLMVVPTSGQVLRDDANREIRSNSGKDKARHKDATSKAKRGIKTWTVNEMSGLTDSVATDTLMHEFQSIAMAEGVRGFYNTLGNIGSPRLAKVFTMREDMNYNIFTQPYDYFLKPMSKLHFTNTFSPITNITYHECGSSDNGEDQLSAKYAVNINRNAGIGFHINYLYGRGYHDNQATADFNFNLYGSVVKDQYKAHWLIFANYLKTNENGGITNDRYVTDPQQFPSSYTTREIPTRLDKVWNKMHINGAQLTHRYSLGYRKVVRTNSDTTQQHTDTIAEPQPQIPEGALLANQVERNTIMGESLTATSAPKADSTVFVPVTSVVHTLKLGINSRKFLANESLKEYYTYNYLGRDSVNEHIDNVLISNYLALELSEGLNKYLSAGIRLFAVHDFNNYKMPGLSQRENFNENRISIGAQIFREKSERLNYQLTAQTSNDGDSWGEYELRGQGRLMMPMFKDSVALTLRASSVNRKPTFFYRHYQSNYLWWNNNLSMQLTNRIGATLDSKKLDMRLSADAYTISNYTYFATVNNELPPTSTEPTTPRFSTNTIVDQSSKNINILAVALDKNFTFGPLHWENSLVWQTSSDKLALPLPTFTAYTNLFLKFKIAKVLNTEFGANLKYFTRYYAPTYSVALNQFATQAPQDLTKVGNHPIISAYLNFQLQHTRFYLMVSHLNYSSDGDTTFGAPHYPVNPMVIRFGLSWNFFN